MRLGYHTISVIISVQYMCAGKVVGLMGPENAQEWHTVNVRKAELNLDLTLSSGQVFSWHLVPHHQEDGNDVAEWRGVIQDR